MSSGKSTRKKGGQRKYGRNLKKCERYRKENRREKNKEKRIAKEKKRQEKLKARKERLKNENSEKDGGLDGHHPNFSNNRFTIE